MKEPAHARRVEVVHSQGAARAIGDLGVVGLRAAWEVLSSFEKPLLCCFSDSDPVTGGGDPPFRKLVPGAKGQPHTTIEGGGHFLQEDRGPELARVLIDFIAATS